MSRKIAILGAGAVGTAWAFSLIRANHQVTLIARGARLARLRQDNNFIYSRGYDKSANPIKVPVDVDTALDSSKPWDLVVVTILAHQLDDTLLSTLKACQPSTQILFLFNTFADLESYRQAVGSHRFISGFPAISALFQEDGTIVHSFPFASVISDETWCAVFMDAGIPCVIEKDMQSWLRTHVAVAVGLLSVMLPAGDISRGASWQEAYKGARIVLEGSRLVGKLGNRWTPWHHALIFRLPVFLTALLLWIASRVPRIREITQTSPTPRNELINLSDAMIKLAPSPDDVRLIRQMRAKY